VKVLVACEYSGVVRRAFRGLGHDAYSCDLLPAEDDSPYHFQEDVLGVLDRGWDLMIGHPTCTYMTNSGVCWLHKDPSRWAKLDEATEFFLKLWNAPIPRIALENPIMHKYAIDRIGVRQSQVIQPYMFGHPERKATCLWLKNLPKLTPTDNVKAYMDTLPKNVAQRIHYLPPSPDRWKERSRTFGGIGKAMAAQWSQYILGAE